jgi:hypothetical protein
MNQIVVRDGKGAEDRVTVLPAVAKAVLAEHLQRVKRQHEADLTRDAGWVELPWVLTRKYPNAAASGRGNGSSRRPGSRPTSSTAAPAASRAPPTASSTRDEPHRLGLGEGRRSVNILGPGNSRRPVPGGPAKDASDQTSSTVDPTPSTALPCSRRRFFRATQFRGITSWTD